MIKKLMVFAMIFISINASAALIGLEWRFSSDGLLSGKAYENPEWLDMSFERLATYQVDIILPSTEHALHAVLTCYANDDYWCNYHNHTKLATTVNKITYSFDYSHYAISNWPVKNNYTSVAEPLMVLLLFIGFILLFFRGLRNRLKERHVHNFPVIF